MGDRVAGGVIVVKEGHGLPLKRVRLHEAGHPVPDDRGLRGTEEVISVVTEAGEGVVTSGIFSPTLGYSIALARVPRAATGACEVEIRGKHLPARLVRPPFVRHGERVHK